MLVAILFVAKTSWDVSHAFRATSQVKQLNSNMRKQLMMNRIAAHLGYGGAIHQFKNYEIRRRERFHAATLSELAATRTLIEAYRELGEISEAENTALNKLLELGNMMSSGLLPIKQMIKERIKSPEIDHQVATDYREYREAFDTMEALLQEQQIQMMAQLDATTPQLSARITAIEADIQAMGGLYLSMGYGGVIHQFKNYILQRKHQSDAYQQQLSLLRVALTEMTAHIQELNDEPLADQALSDKTINNDPLHHDSANHDPVQDKSVNPLDASKAALEELAGLPDAYAQAMRKAVQLYADGKSLRLAARKSKVKMDKAYINDLAVLSQGLVHRFLQEQERNHAYLAGVVELNQQRLFIAIVVLVVCVLLAIFLFAIQLPRLMAKSIDAVSMVIGGGEKQGVHSLTQRKDEFGQLACAIEQSGEILLEQEKQRQEQRESERLQVEAQQRQERAMQRNQLADDFEATLGRIISDIAGQVVIARQRAAVVADKATLLMQQSSDVSDDSRQGVVLVESTEHASSALRSAIMEMGDKAAQARNIADQAMNDTTEIHAMVQRLGDVSRRVETVVKSISNVAINTRVLAMNATIEAASAGAAGKGFAVVANEVKELAAESSQAVKNIAEEMAYMQQEITATSQVLNNTVDKINGIHGSTETVAKSVDQQVASIQTMAEDAHAASGSMQGVIEVLKSLSYSASESELASTELRQAIDEVHEKAGDADTRLHQFLQSIRS